MASEAAQGGCQAGLGILGQLFQALTGTGGEFTLPGGGRSRGVLRGGRGVDADGDPGDPEGLADRGLEVAQADGPGRGIHQEARLTVADVGQTAMGAQCLGEHGMQGPFGAGEALSALQRTVLRLHQNRAERLHVSHFVIGFTAPWQCDCR